MKVNFYLADAKSKKETRVVCFISANGNRVKVNTDITAEPRHWNSLAQEFRKSHPNYNELNHWLNEIKSHITKSEAIWKSEGLNINKTPSVKLSYLQECVRIFIGRLNDKELEKVKACSFWGYFDTLLTRMDNGSRGHLKTGKPLASKTVFQFHNLKRHLFNFEKHTKTKIDFSVINQAFYKAFSEYLTITLNSSPNTIGKLMTNLKIVLREAYEDGVTQNDFFRSRAFISPNSVSDTIYLSQIEVDAILALDLSKSPSLERVRDVFIIGCYTGLRFSDLMQISPGCIDANMIQLVQVKTGSKVLVPIRPIVLQLLTKYNFNLPKISNQKFNDYLHEVCEIVDCLSSSIDVKSIKGGKKVVETKLKSSLVTSHTARRTFATNEYKLGELTVAEIMSITGHKTTKSFYKYIRETPNEVSLRVASIWSDRDKKDGEFNTLLKVV
jgi:integrase